MMHVVRPSPLLILLFVLVIAGLAPVTYASPPDPSWLGGWWDDDDFDDVVLLIGGAVAVVPSLTVDPAPPVEVMAVVEDHKVPAGTLAVDEAASPRGPPLTVF
jgi:hypothetical protein